MISSPPQRVSHGKPILLWDGFALDRVHSGIGQYARQLAKTLRPLGWSPIVIRHRDATARKSSTNPPCDDVWHTIEVPRIVVAGKIGRSILAHAWTTARYARRLAKSHPDRPVILHGLGNLNLPPHRLGWPPNLASVLTVHDLIPMLRPDEVSRPLSIQFRHALPRVVASADAVVCVSDWTRRELLGRVSHRNCHTIRTGRPLVKSSTDRTGHVPTDPAGTTRLLSVSRWETYKRFELLLEIIRQSATLRLDLVTDDRGCRFAEDTAGDLMRSGKLRVHTSLSKPRLDDLVKRCDAYVQTSLLEGFCLPALDALIAHKPVVYQSGSGIDEVCGRDVACPMRSSDHWSNWITAIDATVDRSRSTDFAGLCERQIAHLGTWQDTATGYAQLYDRLSRSRRPVAATMGDANHTASTPRQTDRTVA